MSKYAIIRMTLFDRHERVFILTASLLLTTASLLLNADFPYVSKIIGIETNTKIFKMLI